MKINIYIIILICFTSSRASEKWLSNSEVSQEPSIETQHYQDSNEVLQDYDIRHIKSSENTKTTTRSYFKSTEETGIGFKVGVNDASNSKLSTENNSYQPLSSPYDESYYDSSLENDSYYDFSLENDSYYDFSFENYTNITYLKPYNFDFDLDDDLWSTNKELYTTIFHVCSFVILIIGLIFNGILLLVFMLHPEVRTSQNVMLFNIVVLDLINALLLLAEIICTISEQNDIQTAVEHIHFAILHVMTLSVIGFSAQRYIAILTSLKAKFRIKINSRTRNVIYVFTIWAMGLLFGISIRVPVVESESLKAILILTEALFLFLSVPIFVILFNALTSRLLRQSARHIPGEGSQAALVIARYRSSRIVIGIAVAYFMGFVPNFLLIAYILLSNDIFIQLQVIFISQLLFYCTVIINPLALYISSGTFRKLINKYLFICCYKRKLSNLPSDAEIAKLKPIK